MNFQSGYVKKICSFYAGDCHFATMMLPYLTKNIKVKANIEVILDEDIKQYIDKLLEKINIEEKMKQNIEKIKWSSFNIKLKDIEEYIKEKLKKDTDNIFIIKMKKENPINKKLTEVLMKKENFIINNKIKLNLIYCYDIENLKSIDNIIREYEYVLNTSGIHEIKEVFQCNIKENEEIIENKFVG